MAVTRTQRRLLRRRCGWFFVVVLTLGAAAPEASATYEVRTCGDAEGVNSAWNAAATAPTGHLSLVAKCGAGQPDPYGSLETGLAAIDVTSVAGAQPDGSFVEWRITAAAGTVITAGSVDRDIGNRDEWTPYGRIDGADQPGESCQRGMNQSFCRIRGRRSFAALNARTIAYGIRCTTAPYCAHLWDLHAVWALVLGATVTVDDREAPVVGAPSATGLADGEWHNGPGVVSFSATDNTGIRRRRVVVGGVERAVAVAPGAAAAGCGQLNQGVAYTFTQPCSGARGLNGVREMTVDPCSWGDGLRQVRAGVTDTGGLEVLSSAATPVKVDCTAPTVSVATGTAQAVEGDPIAPVVSASDAASGVASTAVEVSVDGGPWAPAAGGVTAVAGRSYRFRARATDVAGNERVSAVSATVAGVARPVEPEPGPEEPEEPARPRPATRPAPSAKPAPRRVPPAQGPSLPKLAPPVPTLARARVRILRVRSRGRTVLRITGRVDARRKGRIAVTVKRRGRRPLRRTAKPTRGRFALTLRGVRRSSVVRVTVVAPATLTHAVGRATWRGR